MNHTSTCPMKKTKGVQEKRYSVTKAMSRPCIRHWYGPSKNIVVITVALRNFVHLDKRQIRI